MQRGAILFLGSLVLSPAAVAQDRACTQWRDIVDRSLSHAVDFYKDLTRDKVNRERDARVRDAGKLWLVFFDRKPPEDPNVIRTGGSIIYVIDKSTCEIVSFSREQ